MLWYFFIFPPASRQAALKSYLLFEIAPETPKLKSKSQHWQRTALAAATATLLGIAATDAMALSLGRLTVQSALGEPLRAEIDILDINADEADSLKTSIAPPDAFVAAGLEYNATMSSLRASLQKRADGRSYIRLSSDRTINDPFVDLILEVNWSNGRIVRDYTMLFDPPALRAATNTAPTLAQTPAASPKAAATTPTPVAATPAPTTPAAPAKTAAKDATPKAESTDKAKTASGDASRQITVKAGDTASKIAGANKPAGVSLDQMLVAMLAASPDAFVNDNVNRLRKGAVLQLPTEEQIQATPADKASQIVIAQSKDFNSFRKNLATSAPVQTVTGASQQASGKVESKIEDKKPSTNTPDKLTLSKGSVQAKAEDKIAKAQAEKDAKARAAELEKNIADLKKIGAASSTPAAATATAPAPKASGITAPVGAVAAPISAPTAPASAPAVAASMPQATASAPAATASAPVETASAPAKKPVVTAPVPAPAPIEEPSLIDELIDNPMTPLAAGGLVALIAGLGFWRVRQRKKNAAQVDSSFLESRLQPDSFFGASGGQHIDTTSEISGNGTASSMVYSPSQLDAADDVDPVAEADVYLAYGRDLQAEEILKEAAKNTPGRLAIHTKLLEIYAKRKDTRSFETSATQAFKIAGHASQDWGRICEMGLSIDPKNPLYQPGGIPEGAGASDTAPSPADSTMRINVPVQSAAATAAAPAAAAPAAGLDLDLDLDFSLDDEPSSAISDVTGGNAQPVSYVQTVKMGAESAAAPQANSTADNGLDFNMPSTPATGALEPVVPSLPSISLDLDTPPDAAGNALQFDATSPIPVEVPSSPTPAADHEGMLEFDLGSLQMGLDAPAQPTQAPSMEGEDPLETKLALAEEFVSIGDEDGARALIEEVLSEATGATREKAQRALSQLS